MTILELTFLGTGAGIPSRLRNVSSVAITFPRMKNETWLFDCGEGTQHQILQATIKPNKIRNIFISHLHGDHLFGLPGLISTRSALGEKKRLTIYGPKGIKMFLETILDISQTHLSYSLDIIEIQDNMSFTLCHHQVEIRQLVHGIPSYGFRITFPDRPGKLDQHRLMQFGVPPGPIYGELKQGKTVHLEDGRVLDGRQFLSPPLPGEVVVYLGDTRPTPNAIILANRADVLIHEATFGKALSEKARLHYHSTTVEAATIAKKANVKTLILTHISSRYQEEDEKTLLAEAQKIFPNTYLAKDFWTFSLTNPINK